MNLVVHHLLFTLRAETLVHLGPQAGAQVRGALWAALQQFACAAPSSHSDPDHARHCPMCRLVALETATDPRGANPPRPFAIRPPLGAPAESDSLFRPGDTFIVGVNLFGDSTDLFPYLCQAFYRMGEIGIGYGRGRFAVTRVQAFDPLTGVAHDLLDAGRVIGVPDLPVTSARVRAAAADLSTQKTIVHFLTPTQLTRQGGLIARWPDFATLIARLLERCQALEHHYTACPTDQAVWKARYLELTHAAQQVALARNLTYWVRVESGSRRTNSRNTVGGIVGSVRYAGDLAPFREWLLWGQSVHVGKNAVKGNGWFKLDGLEPISQPIGS